MLKGFRDFIMRGNVIELAVAVAIGTAFTAVVTQFGNSFIKPLVAVFAGGGAAGGTFVVRGQRFDYGAFINAMIFFLITAAVIYFLVVAPYNAFEARRKRGQGPSTRRLRRTTSSCSRRSVTCSGRSGARRLIRRAVEVNSRGAAAPRAAGARRRPARAPRPSRRPARRR